MLGSLILYLKGMRTTMFQLSGFYYMKVPLRADQGLIGWYGVSQEGRERILP